MKKQIVAAILTLLFTAFVASVASAVPSDDYRYKWPWRHDTSLSYIGTYPFSGVHGCYPDGEYPYECVAAYDLNIANSVVVASNEGDVTHITDTYAPNDCGSGKSYGNYVDAGGVRYAHFNSIAPGLLGDSSLLQGDQVGVEGATGNVIPCPGGKHLHWQFLAGSVPTIDADSWGVSTNSLIGEYSSAGLALRTYYINHGGWNSIGWTTKHCPGTCTLNMTANNHWGRMQDFRHDPDPMFGQEFATILVAKWDLTNDEAYRADSVFWPAWAGGAYDHVGTLRPLSMAQNEAGACPPGSNPACVSYQRFHLGYVWLASNGVASASFCSDVFPLPKGDGAVRAQDAQWIYSLYRDHVYDWRGDINGDGFIASSEAQFVFAEYNAGVGACHP